MDGKKSYFHLNEKGYYRYKIGALGNEVDIFVIDTNMLPANPMFEIPLKADGSEVSLAEAKELGS